MSVGVPEDLGVTELRAANVEYGIAGVFDKGKAVIIRVGDLLGFAGRGVEGVDCHDTVGLVREEAGGVVDVYNGRAGEDSFIFCTGEDGNRLVSPAVEVLRGGVTPVLVAGYDACWIVLTIDLVSTYKQLKNKRD